MFPACQHAVFLYVSSLSWLDPLSSNLLISGRFAFVLCSRGMSFKKAPPSLPSQSLWLDFQMLISSTAFTRRLIHRHNHILINLEPNWLIDSFFTRVFASCLPPENGWAQAFFLLWRIGFNLPTSLTVFLFASSLSACLPPLLFVTIQPTLSLHTSATLSQHCRAFVIVCAANGNLNNLSFCFTSSLHLVYLYITFIFIFNSQYE